MNSEKESLHIGYFCDSYYPLIDGVVTVMDNTAKTLLNKGIEVSLIVPKHKGKTVVNKEIISKYNSNRKTPHAKK